MTIAQVLRWEIIFAILWSTGAYLYIYACKSYNHVSSSDVPLVYSYHILLTFIKILRVFANMSVVWFRDYFCSHHECSVWMYDTLTCKLNSPCIACIGEDWRSFKVTTDQNLRTLSTCFLKMSTVGWYCVCWR